MRELERERVELWSMLGDRSREIAALSYRSNNDVRSRTDIIGLLRTIVALCGDVAQH